MSAPHVPGDTDHPEWWTPADDAILAGVLAELDALPRPAVVEPMPAIPATPAERPAPPWRMIVALVVALCVVMLGVLVAAAPSSPAPAVAPTTYGPPGPRGGAFTSMPVR